MVVVVGITALMMTAITGVLGGVFKAKTRITLADRVEQNGAWAAEEMRRMILSASGEQIDCPTVGAGSSLGVIDDSGQETVIKCLEGDKIASESAGESVWLTGINDVKAESCGTFVSCDTLPSSTSTVVSRVRLNFTLSAGETGGGPESRATKNFRVEVTTRD